MSDVPGRVLSNALTSAISQLFLTNKFPLLPDTAGSMIYTIKWTEKTTPAGILYSQQQALAPRVPRKNQTKNSLTPRSQDSGIPLSQQAALAGWGTPNTMDILPVRSPQAMYNQARNGGRKNRSFPGNLREQVDETMQQVYQDAILDAQNGVTQTSYTTEITSNGKLNPRLSGWLMGFPIIWCYAAIKASEADNKIIL